MNFEINFSPAGHIIITEHDSEGIHMQACETLREAFDLIKSLIVNAKPIDKPNVTY